MDREAPRATFDTPSRLVVVEPVEPPETAVPIAVPVEAERGPDDEAEQPPA